MSTFLSAWSPWFSSPGLTGFTLDLTGLIPAGSDRCVTIECYYTRNENNFPPMAFTATFANATETPYRSFNGSTPNLRQHIYRWCLGESNIAGAVSENNYDFVVVGAGSNTLFWRYCVVENANQTDPWPTSAHIDVVGYDSGGNNPPHVSNTLLGTPNRAQSMTFAHTTQNRSYTLDGTWDGGGGTVEDLPHENTKTIVAVKATGGNQTYTAVQNNNDSAFTLMSACEWESPIASGPTVLAVSGDDKCRTDRTEVVVGAELENVTAVLLDGVTQSEFDNPGTGSQLTFKTTHKGAGNLPYGAGKTLTFVDPVNGDFTHTIELLPKEGRSYGTVAGYTPGDPESVFSQTEFGGTVVNGDQWEADDKDDQGRGVTFNDNGTYEVAGVGSGDASLFYCDALTNGAYVGEIPVYTNIGPVVTHFMNQPINELPVFPSSAVNLTLGGFNFGNTTGKVYAKVDTGERPIRDDVGVLIEQTTDQWADSGDEAIRVPAYEPGTIPQGSSIVLIVKKATT